ncbi:MAG TPA: DUF3365 domain-containing protein [Aggregatilineales bacterium]|nr:DUF3365 domain-containing protein [Anaerolineales bacterium]HRE46206.1 DUF3365 domain-containing protein [Aggregatilineales bacterium]
MFARLALGHKFTLFLSVVFLVGIAAGGIVLWRTLNAKAERDVTSNSLLLMETMSAIRSYTSQHIQPLLRSTLESSETFIAETVPAFSARTVFEKVRSDEDYRAYLYKEATLNPTNPLDLVDDFERGIVERFRTEADLRQLSGFRPIEGDQLFYIARPLRVSAESCLVCHSTPAAAPSSLIRSYGDQNGFGWQLNEIIAAQMIYVPAGEVYAAAFQSFVGVIVIFAGAFLAAILVFNFLLRRYVIQPVGVLGNIAAKLGADTLTGEQLQTADLASIAKRQDELGKLAKLFRRMAQDVVSREKQLKQRVMELNIEIDEIKKAKQVQEVTDSEFFKDLQSRATSLRRRHVDKTTKGTLKPTILP